MNPVSSSFQYQEAANRLRLFIGDKNLRYGDRLPPEREFAALFGMGRPTVNKAIACLIAEGMLRRDGYKLYVAGAPLLAAKTYHIGVLCPHPLHRKQRVSHNLIEAAHDVCHLAKVGFTPMLSLDGLQQREQMLEILKLKPDGIVIWPHPGHSYLDLFQQVAQRNIPLVVNDCNWGPFDFVGVDNFAGIRAILGHLSDLGHRQVAYLTRKISIPNLEERCEAYRHVSSLLFSSPSQKRIYQIPGNDEEGLPDLFKNIRRKDPSVTAICCSHDAVAIELIRICLQSGIDVPEQLSITGFDGIEAGETCQRPLTTVSQDFYQLGSLAVDLLIRRIRMRQVKHASEVQQIHVTPHLVVRASTSPPRRPR
ncbi:MAG: GntR family transcriptional regulator [Terrimicrobiaceae bacterium]